MQMLNIAGYKFIELDALIELKSRLLDCGNALELKGTILLSTEGINVTLSGASAQVADFVQELREDPRFSDLTFRESYSEFQPFKHLQVKIKPEIITFRRPEIKPELQTAPAISPQEFKEWLDEDREITILDTRNDYEVRFGAFSKALNLHIDEFGQFPDNVSEVPRNKPVVMYCTGGVRCEKAAWVLLNAGYSDVYQLEGGILNYFTEVGGDYYQGECFVFDQRIAVDASLKATGTTQCRICQGPIKQSDTMSATRDTSCSACVNHLT